MPEIGYVLSSEQTGPNELVDQAAQAEAAGFDFVTLTDHYHPWISQNGHSPFPWTVVGGLARATEEVRVGTGVTCPIIRYHPAIVAQAAATAATMLPNRFFLGVGTGENLNEHVTGRRWPEHRVRLEMLEEAVEIIRNLWTGEVVSHHGEYYTVENARLYTRPEDSPPLHVSAFGPRAARMAGEIGDGFVGVGPKAELVETFESAGGEGPRYGQATVCYADSREEALEIVRDRWPIAALSGEVKAELPTPAHYEQLGELVTTDDIDESGALCDPDPSAHIEHVRSFADAGYDRVAVHEVGPDVDGFFELYEGEVLPEFS